MSLFNLHFQFFLESEKFSSIKSLNVSSRLFFSNPNYLVYWTSTFLIHYLSNSFSSLSSNSTSTQIMRISQICVHHLFHFLSALYCFSGDFTFFHVILYSLTVLGPFYSHFIFYSYLLFHKLLFI